MIGLLRRSPLAERWRARRDFWRSLNHTGEWELKELARYVPRKRLSIDVGGNLGIYSYHMRRLSRGVVTFEPNPMYAARLRRIGLGRGLQEVALSDRAGAAELRIPMWEGHEAPGLASLEAGAVPESVLARTVEVPVRRLDDYAFAGVGFIKIDVEGHEEGVLRGALQTIRRHRPTLLIEIEERHNPGGLERIERLLAGYDGFFFVNGQRRPLMEFDPAVHQREADLDSACKARRASPYVNNFLFVPSPQGRPRRLGALARRPVGVDDSQAAQHLG